jgi:hypothetical protein
VAVWLLVKVIVPVAVAVPVVVVVSVYVLLTVMVGAGSLCATISATMPPSGLCVCALTRAASDSRTAGTSSGGDFDPHPNAKVRTTPTSHRRSVLMLPLQLSFRSEKKLLERARRTDTGLQEGFGVVNSNVVCRRSRKQTRAQLRRVSPLFEVAN